VNKSSEDNLHTTTISFRQGCAQQSGADVDHSFFDCWSSGVLGQGGSIVPGHPTAGLSRKQYTEKGDEERGRAYSPQVRSLYLQPDPEEEKENAHLRERAQNGIRTNPMGDAGAEEDSGQDFADYPGLPPALTEMGQELRRAQDE
jgi:hypothetical protein